MRKDLRPGDPPYDDKDYNLVTVWDARIREYRKIPVDNILELKYDHLIWRSEDADSKSA